METGSATDGGYKVTLSAVWYGDCRNSTTELPIDRLFTGQRYDDTGLYYYGARYYDPEIGRFISPDTIVTDPMSSQAWNRYTYCLNNPLKYNDPTGHDINDSNDDRIKKALDIIYDVCPQLYEILNSSDLPINIRFGKAEDFDSSTSLAETASMGHVDQNGNVKDITSIEIVLRESFINPDEYGAEGIAFILFHELGHALTIDKTRDKPTPTMFEEHLIMQNQYEFGGKIGFSPSGDNTGFGCNGPDKMQSHYSVVSRASQVNSNLSGTALRSALINCYKSTYYFEGLLWWKHCKYEYFLLDDPYQNTMEYINSTLNIDSN